MLLGAASVVIFIGMSFSQSYEEISWKEFVYQYLNTGKVERLEIVNQKWVRIVLSEGYASRTGNTLWINIGSTDTFERNLENAQLDAHIEPSNFIPTVYKSEIDGGTLMSALPNLLIFGLIIYSLRATSRGCMLCNYQY